MALRGEVEAPIRKGDGSGAKRAGPARADSLACGFDGRDKSPTGDWKRLARHGQAFICDLSAAITAMTQAGFVHRHAAGLDMFLAADNAGARDAVHVVFAAEKVRPDYFEPAPDTTESEATESFRLLSLSALARMKLTSFRDKDRTHLRDLIEVRLLDASWVARLPSELGVRLQHLLDNPEG